MASKNGYDSKNSPFKCYKCHLDFDGKERQPLLLPCGDTLCKHCLLTVENTCDKKKGKKQCPKCLKNWDKSLVKHLQINKICIPSGSDEQPLSTGSDKEDPEPLNYDDFLMNHKTNHNGEVEAEVENSTHLQRMCKFHTEVVSSWCDSHMMFLCRECIRVDHGQCHHSKLGGLQTLPKDLAKKAEFIENTLHSYNDSLNDTYLHLDVIDQYIETFKNLMVDFEAHDRDLRFQRSQIQEQLEKMNIIRSKLLSTYDPYNIFEEGQKVMCDFTDLFEKPEAPPNPRVVIQNAIQVMFLNE